ncbi:MAG: TonB-dependent receptor [Sphingobium sp.]
MQLKAALLVAVAAAGVPATSYGQDAVNAGGSDKDASQRGGLEDIVVTARKVAENLQDVPVAVTAFTGEQLEQQAAVRVADIQRMTPGLYIREANSANTAATFTMRGQVQTDVVASLDPSVGVYVDGLYWSRAYGVNADLLDVQSVQVLKGPQGTLFGRNTTGGAILIQTNDPDPTAFSGSLSASYGRFDERAGTAVVNVPLVEGRVAIRASANFLKRDGYVRETNSGLDIGERDSWTGRVKLLAKPTETTSILLAAEVFKQDALTNPYRLRFVSRDSLANTEAGFELFGPGAPATRSAQGAAFLAGYIPGAQNSDNVTLIYPTRSYAKTQTYSATFSLDTFFGAIKAVGGYRAIKAFSPIDLDGSPINILRTRGAQDLKQYSGEFQVTGKALDDQVDFAAGAFYMRETGTDSNESFAITSLNANNPNFYSGAVANDSMGFYSQATWHPTEALGITGGVRYSVDDKGLKLSARTFNGATSAYRCSLGGTSLPDCTAQRTDSFAGVSYTLGVDYAVTTDVLLYAKTSKGFRSGGQNLRATGEASASFIPFRPEIAFSHEGGFKSEFLDRRLRLNVAAYYTTVNDIQRSTIVVSPTGQSATIVGNAGKIRLYGLEAEASALIAEAFRFGATASITKPKYVRYIDPNSGVDRRSERFRDVPEWTFSLSASYTHRFDFGRFRIGSDFSWQAKTALSTENNPLDPDNDAIIAATTMKAVGLLSARASIELLDDRLEIAAFGRNLTDRRGPMSALYLPAPLDIVSTQNREPRTYGLSATYRFGQN